MSYESQEEFEHFEGAMEQSVTPEEKKFECLPYCVFPKLSGVVFDCDKCIKKIMKPLTTEQKEKILVILNEG